MVWFFFYHRQGRDRILQMNVSGANPRQGFALPIYQDSRWIHRPKAWWALYKIVRRYRQRINEQNDISGHLSFLRELSRSCGSVCEMGVRRCVSSWAFLLGLAESSARNKELLCIDIEAADISDLVLWGRNLAPPVNVSMLVADSRKVELRRDYDLVFIDTLHVYGQLKKELFSHEARARRYICLHDTEVDRNQGEVLRKGMDVARVSLETGIQEIDLCRGLWPAVTEFLENFPDWVMLRHFTHNNGLTVLARKTIRDP